MSLLETIRMDQIAARKARDVSEIGLLTTLLSEATIPGKNAGRESTDEEVIVVVKKFLNGIDETLKAIGPGNEYYIDERTIVLSHEKELLNKYLPVQKTETELREIINEFIDILGGELNPKMMGKIMGMLKTSYAGQFDGALASKIIKEIMAK